MHSMYAYAERDFFILLQQYCMWHIKKMHTPIFIIPYDNLNHLTINTAHKFLDKGGALIMKTFQNNNLKSLRKNMELSFKLVQTYKPAASKKQSGEIYLYGVK